VGWGENSLWGRWGRDWYQNGCLQRHASLACLLVSACWLNPVLQKGQTFPDTFGKVGKGAVGISNILLRPRWWMGRVLLLVGVLLSGASAATADVHDFTLSKDQMHSTSFERSYGWCVADQMHSASFARNNGWQIRSAANRSCCGGSANLTVKKRECSFLRY
jgi:hypothetical protein